MLNNRETAILVWTGLFLGWILIYKPTRSELPGIVKLLFGPKLRTPLGLMASYVAGMIYLLHRFDALGTSQIFETVFWVFGPAVSTLFSYEKAEKDPHFFRHRVLANLQFAVLIEFAANLFSFALGWELIFVPCATILVLLGVFSGTKDEYAQVKKLFDGLTSAIGLGLLLYVTLRAIGDFSAVINTDNLRDLSVPILLSIGFLPFVYAFAVVARYEQAFLFLRDLDDEPAPKPEQRRAQLFLIKTFRLRIRSLSGFTYYWQKKLLTATSRSERESVVAEYTEHLDKRNRAAIESERVEAGYQQALLRHAGDTGVDEQGRPLDRREFRETTKALDFLANCQMGWYHKPGKRYPTDLLDRFQDDFSTQGLPTPSGIKLRVSKDGQSWYAWRETPCGHYFAIGAAGPPPNQWKYDGRKRPKSFPGKDPAWGDRPFDLDAEPNW